MLKRFVMASLLLATVEVLATPRLYADPALKPRKFYLTTGTFDAAGAPTACAIGFHMANLFEIFDPSNLVYDTSLGLTSADSGDGPPTGGGFLAWIRTGGKPHSNTGNAGQDNCNAFTTNSFSATGTVVGLTGAWVGAVNPVNPWDAEESACDLLFNVWCVQNR